MQKHNVQEAAVGETAACRKADHIFRKVAWRLMPFLFLIFVLAMIDRVNIGYAKLYFSQDLGFSDVVYGAGAGAFFVGFVLADVPSNLLLYRFGTRITISRIMISWGLVSSAMMFIVTPTHFYLLRFALGLAEGGLFPGIYLYLTFWFPARLRAKMLALSLAAIPVAGLIGAPISGYLLHLMSDVGKLRGWQWMFLFEGLPSVIVGAIAYFYLEDSPQDAPWLTESEKRAIHDTFSLHSPQRAQTPRVSWRHAIVSPVFRLLVTLQIINGIANSSFSFWLPQIVHDLGITDSRTNGLVTAIPYLCAAIGITYWGYSSDQKRERRWHYALAAIVGASGLTIVCGSGRQIEVAIAGLSLAYVGALSCTCVFWAYTTTYLKDKAAVIGIGLINSIAALVSYVSLIGFGAVRSATHSANMALSVIAILMLGAGLLAFRLPTYVENED
ncbi:MFS transporter [Caballeronia sp. GAFFF1]|uniref:MFS transporter n=1 Tax=Caballeronia sp. GAFFF1 TaxID=2921779 RepID=UPI002028A26A|nr:MFS transporter [Caballeronia sp. GAFFF1]